MQNSLGSVHGIHGVRNNRHLFPRVRTANALQHPISVKQSGTGHLSQAGLGTGWRLQKADEVMFDRMDDRLGLVPPGVAVRQHHQRVAGWLLQSTQLVSPLLMITGI